MKLLHAHDGGLEPQRHLLLAGISGHAQAVEAGSSSGQVLRALVCAAFERETASAAAVS